MMHLKSIDDLTRDDLKGLLTDAALNWLALDGLWCTWEFSIENNTSSQP
jgi:hypothetical protein